MSQGACFNGASFRELVRTPTINSTTADMFDLAELKDSPLGIVRLSLFVIGFATVITKLYSFVDALFDLFVLPGKSVCTL